MPSSPAPHHAPAPTQPPASGMPTAATAATAPSRRELNRRATQAAIVTAALNLAETQAWDDVTIDRVAEAAGISRRTFFNYFRSLEDALQHPLLELVEAASLGMADEEPTAERVLEKLITTLHQVLSLERLTLAARVMVISSEVPSLQAAELATWDRCIRALTPPAETTAPAALLYVSTLLRAAIGAAQAALHVWSTQLVGAPSEQDVAGLRDLVKDAISLLRDGFAQPSWLSDEAMLTCAPPGSPFLAP